MNDKKYWEAYYEQRKQPFEPSLFALWCVAEMLKKGDKVIELGCGNGRDAVFMAEKGINVLAVDQCQTEIDFLNKHFAHENLKFVCGDFSKLQDFGPFDAVYSRFTLHAISEAQENSVLEWAGRNLKKNGRLLIEARGQENEYFGLGKKVENEEDAYIYEEHYRRFLNRQILCKKIAERGLNIRTADEKKGRSPFNGTDFKFMRIVASKER